MQEIPSLDKIHVLKWKTAALNELCFELLFCKEDSKTGAVYDALSQNPEAQTTISLRILRSEPGVTVFRAFNKHSQIKVADMRDGAYREGNILSAARVDGSIVPKSDLYRPLNSVGTSSKVICRLLQQERDRSDKKVVWYNKMLSKILRASCAQQYRRARKYSGKEMFHYKNVSQRYIHQQRTLFSLLNYCKK